MCCDALVDVHLLDSSHPQQFDQREGAYLSKRAARLAARQSREDEIDSARMHLKAAREHEVSVKDRLRTALAQRDRATEVVRSDDMLTKEKASGLLAPVESKVSSERLLLCASADVPLAQTGRRSTEIMSFACLLSLMPSSHDIQVKAVYAEAVAAKKQFEAATVRLEEAEAPGTETQLSFPPTDYRKAAAKDSGKEGARLRVAAKAQAGN